MCNSSILDELFICIARMASDELLVQPILTIRFLASRRVRHCSKTTSCKLTMRHSDSHCFGNRRLQNGRHSGSAKYVLVANPTFLGHLYFGVSLRGCSRGTIVSLVAKLCAMGARSGDYPTRSWVFLRQY